MGTKRYNPAQRESAEPWGDMEKDDGNSIKHMSPEQNASKIAQKARRLG